ncbi:MAG: YbbR-like domain-containing protein [Gemmatimonadota bacterium]
MKVRWASVVDWLVSDWGLKVTALGLAFLIWALGRADSPGTDVLADVPVQLLLRDAAWDTVGAPTPPAVSLRVSGPVRDLARLRMGDPTVVRVVMNEVVDSAQVVTLLPRHVQWGAPGLQGVSVESITPEEVQFTFDRMDHTFLPVAPRTRGAPPPGFELAGPVRADPPEVRASGARRRLASVDSLRLRPVDLSDVRATDTVTMAIDTSGTGLLITPQRVRVIVPMQRVDSLVADTLGGAAPAAAR